MNHEGCPEIGSLEDLDNGCQDVHLALERAHALLRESLGGFNDLDLALRERIEFELRAWELKRR